VAASSGTQQRVGRKFCPRCAPKRARRVFRAARSLL